MDGGESVEERQENEMQVLQSIYMDALTDHRNTDAWKVRRSPEITLTLEPQESQNNAKAHVSVDLYVKCPSLYPDE